MLDDGSMRSVEYDRVGIVSNFSYGSEFFGGDNNPLKTIIELIHTQNQGLVKGIKNASGFRFLGKLTQTVKGEKLVELRNEFNKINLDIKNSGGLGLYDQKFESVQQLKPEPFALNAAQVRLIEDSVWKYFGISENIVKNNYNTKDIIAFLSGKVAPFALQLSTVMSNMTFSERELAFDNKIEFFTDENDYLSFEQKLEIACKGVDRGIITLNEARVKLGFAQIEGGDEIIRRLDYGVPSNADDDEGDDANETKED